jgi:hypothetical protein
MPSVRFEPAIPASDLLQTLVLDRSASGIGSGKEIVILVHEYHMQNVKICSLWNSSYEYYNVDVMAVTMLTPSR